MLSAVDLFCGCGGISAGLRAAGFDIIAGADCEPAYMRTFENNFPEARSLNLDLARVPPDEFMAYLKMGRGELDLLAGGPPCQGFSKNVPRRARFSEDPRNKLMQAFLSYCEELLPRLILMENVAEMKNGFEQAYTEEVESRLRAAGYTVTHTVLNAADYGVPQRRRRAFFIANRYDFMLRLPHATHKKSQGGIGVGTLFNSPSHVNVWEALGDLPSLGHGEGQEIMSYACEPMNSFQTLMRQGSDYVTNHVARHLQPKQHARLSALQPGQGLKDLPEHLKTNGGYSGAYGRLTKDMIAPTITRWVFHPGSGRWGHPVDVRTLTIREVARIQSFPDTFHFVGTFTQRAGQLGNAVPPLLAQRIGESLRAQMGLPNSANISTNCSTLSFSSGVGN